MTAVERLIELLQGCATAIGRDLAPIEQRHLDARLNERDAELVHRGLHSGLLRIDGNYLWTADPHQATAWLVEGAPARPCWEYIPHAAVYVELIELLGYPSGSVRFETPESEAGMSLDLAVVDGQGRVMVLGEVKRESQQIRGLASLLTEYASDPGKPAPRSAGGPSGPRREAQKLAHQLWEARPSLLLLAAAGDRQVFRVRYDDGLHLDRCTCVPSVDDFEASPAVDWPTIRRAADDWPARGDCPLCGSGDVVHLVVGMPVMGAMGRAPAWVEYVGCVVDSEDDRVCRTCGHRWRAG